MSPTEHGNSTLHATDHAHSLGVGVRTASGNTVDYLATQPFEYM